MPSPSSRIASGAPMHSSTTSRVRSRGSAAAWRATKPRMPSSSDSSLPVETSSTRTPSGGSSRSSRASSISSATEARLSFAPGTTGRAGDVGHRERRAERHHAARPAQAAQAEQRAGAGERRPGDDELHQPRRGLLARVPVRERVGDPARRAGMEDQTAARGVVVREEHERLAGVRVAGLGDDVVRRPRAQQPPEQPRPGGDVVGDRRRCGEPACRREPRARCGSVRAAQRPPTAARPAA